MTSTLLQQIINPNRLLYEGSNLPEVVFEFSAEIIPKIISEITLAQKFVRIAMFQIHNHEVFSALSQKAKKGIKIEILTLPYDSIDDDVRSEVEQDFEELRKQGVILYFNQWNVGNPERTTTATNRWYSFHGKFIVTDKSAIGLSANLIKNQELDAAVIFRNDEQKIKEFNEQYDRLLNLFINNDEGFDGSIHRKILEIQGGQDCGVFDLPKGADERHKEHWILHYPTDLCPSDIVAEEKLYLTPFDCRARDFIYSLIEDAEYVYLSTESFTDEDFSAFLSNIATNKKIPIKVLTEPKSMDFTDRINNMLRDLLSRDIDVRTTGQDLHAKLLITDKILVVSSINLNRINLGFKKSEKYWRENTETFVGIKNPELIQYAKAEYDRIFESSTSVKEKLIEKLQNVAKDILSGTYGLRSTEETKKLFARFVLKEEIDLRKLFVKLGSLAKKLLDKNNERTVNKQHLVSALILYYLTERKQDFDQLKEKLDGISEGSNLAVILAGLEENGLIAKENDYYKINLTALNP